MGLGIHGGGVSVAHWFLNQGAQVRITDLKPREKLLPSLNKIHSQKVQYTLGRHRREDFLWADIVVQNPAVPRESPYLKIARQKGAEIENEATLFFKIIGRERIIGITGTKGKSTTTLLTAAILSRKYPGALVGGNIATLPMFQIIEKAQRGTDPIILELSSWHLENLGDQKLSPHTAVLTNILADHLNRYHSLSDYIQAKMNIFRFQKRDDFGIVNFTNPPSQDIGKSLISQRFWFSRQPISEENAAFINRRRIFFRWRGKMEEIVSLDHIRLHGDHHYENILAAVVAARIYGVPLISIRKVLRDFSGIPHRQEPIATINGVLYVNDTAATTPDATRAALMTFGRGKNIILIAGGSDKGIPLDRFHFLGKAIERFCKALILFQGKGSEKILQGLSTRKSSLEIVTGILTMGDALSAARAFSQEKDVILLSPACASFGLFLHEFDRGDQFRKCVTFFCKESSNAAGNL